MVTVHCSPIRYVTEPDRGREGGREEGRQGGREGGREGGKEDLFVCLSVWTTARLLAD